MDSETLRIFIHLADTLHYGKTSKALNMSPPTLSRTIRRLEERLGRKLFERDNRSVQLTKTGEQLKKYARDSLARWAAFLDQIASEDAVLTGEISMYSTITASYGVLPDILNRFRSAYPQIHINLLTGDSESAIQKVLAEDTDFAVAALPDRIPERLHFKTIADIHLQFVAPTVNWAHARDQQQGSLPWDRVPMIVAQKGMARKRTDEWFRARTIRPNIYAQATGNESILAMVSMGFGIGIVPRLVLEKNPISREVQVLKVRPQIKSYSVGICVQKRRMASPIIQAFWEIV